MSGGVDKLILLATFIADEFLQLARERGVRKWGYRYVINLLETSFALPLILFCDGLRDGRHKVEVLGVARLGLLRTRRLLRKVLGHLSGARIYRIDLCTDILGVPVHDLADMFSISRVQNIKIFRKRGAWSFYLQNSAHKTVVLYDKAKQLRATRNPAADMLGPNDQLSRIEVQLSGPAVPFRKIRHLHRYAEIDLFPDVKFRRLKSLPSTAKPLHRLATVGLQRLIQKYGLQATKKQFSPPEWEYIEKLFLQGVETELRLDISGRMKKSIEDWLEDRIRFPRPLFRPRDSSDERS
jgi:hypothetical protein